MPPLYPSRVWPQHLWVPRPHSSGLSGHPIWASTARSQGLLERLAWQLQPLVMSHGTFRMPGVCASSRANVSAQMTAFQQAWPRPSQQLHVGGHCCP